MQADRMTRARARLALRKAVGAHLFDSNVGLVDLGMKESEGQLYEDTLAIRIHVHEKLSGFQLEAAIDEGKTSEIPPTIDGFPTDVQEGVYRPQQWFWRWGGRSSRRSSDPRSSASEPMRGGISVCDENRIGYGTLGGLVRDRNTGEDMILSNWHVLVGDWGMRRGQRIYQPGRRDGGTADDTVATLTRDAMAGNIDAAVATLTGGRGLVNEQLGIGPVTGVRRLELSELGLEVVKSGRRTGITYGVVTGVEGVQKMTYRGLDRIIRNVIAIEPLQAFAEVSAAGDSGAWWLDRSTREVVGLHFAGSNNPERALAIDMQSVVDTLNVDIVT